MLCIEDLHLTQVLKDVANNVLNRERWRFWWNPKEIIDNPLKRTIVIIFNK